jgi:hypothetical protein
MHAIQRNKGRQVVNPANNPVIMPVIKEIKFNV